MKMRRMSVLLLLAAACRQPMTVDTSASKLIPRDVAIERLKERLAEADVAEYTSPRHWLPKDEIKEWHVDDRGLEARAANRAPVGVLFKDVTATRLEKVNLFYQVRIFTAAQANTKKDFLHVNWATEEPARRALELLDALWKKP